jgi:hypothetical protein
MACIGQADVVGPEDMAGQRPDLGDDGGDRHGRSRRIGVFRVADDADDAVSIRGQVAQAL